jgi:hypothetical protein
VQPRVGGITGRPMDCDIDLNLLGGNTTNTSTSAVFQNNLGLADKNRLRLTCRGFAAALSFVADATTDLITLATPTINIATCTAVQLTTSGTLPAGLALATTYYWIKVTNQTGYLATSAANAAAGTHIDITDAGTGRHVLTGTGASNIQYFYRKVTAASGRDKILSLAGDVGATQRIDMQNQQAQDTLMGPVLVTDNAPLDLSAAGASRREFYAQQKHVVLSVQRVYVSETSASTNALLIGKRDSVDVASTSYFNTSNSSNTAVQGTKAPVQNTSGTAPTLAQRLLDKDEYLTFGYAGTSGAAGEVIMSAFLCPLEA